MIKLRQYIIEKPSGQVLLATLFFCFIFMALFIGLYRAGFSYIQKEKAMRSADLTALSVGAVYANGLQLVRWSNSALMTAAIVDIVTKVATEGAIDPELRKSVQIVQSSIFGINQKGDGPGVGIYPFLMWLEGPKLAENNQLRNNWLLSSNKLQMPLPPLPMFLFNAETSDPQWMLVPNMRLKFRTLADLLPEESQVDNEEVYYRHKDSTGTDGYAYYTLDQVEPAKDSKHQGQMWVKGTHAYLQMTPVVTPGTGGKKEKGTFGWALDNAKGFLKDFKLDVVHADDPHNHTVIVYDQLPTSQTKENSTENANYHVVSEMKLVGGGLAAWDLAGGNYFKVRLISIDLTRFPKIRDFVNSIPGVPSAPSIPKVLNILQQVLHKSAIPGFPSTNGSFSGLPQIPGNPQLPNISQAPGVPRMGLPDISQIPNIPGTPHISGLPEIPSSSDIANFFGLDPGSLPAVPGDI